MYYLFDVETSGLPLKDILELAPEFSAPSNWKDPNKIAAEVERKRTEWLQETALSALTGKVIAVGIKPAGKPPVFKLGGSEQEVLGAFWDMYNRITANDFAAKFIGFCSNRFDMPFLLRRSWKHAVPTPEYIVNGFYLNDRFLDLAKRWQLGNRDDHISLDKLARFLGIGSKPSNGASFSELLANDPAKAEDYLRNDLNLTEACARRMGMIPST